LKVFVSVESTMNKADIVRQLQIVRFSPAEKRVVGLRQIAQQARVSHQTVYRIVRTGEISAIAAEKLSAALECVTFRED
jgi:IS30 family transposase